MEELGSSALDRILAGQEAAQVALDAMLAEDTYRPTLVLGLGGTGTIVLKRLKRLIREKFQDKRVDLFQFLALDTEFESMDYYQRLDVAEFLNLAENTILGNQIVQAMVTEGTDEIYKGLRAWWPFDAKGKPFQPGDITSGAKATRCVGRLALWYRGMEVFRSIERKFDNALLIRGLRRSEIPSTGNAAKVFIICSLAGGTGSGMFIDIAYMVRSILDRFGLASFITGLLLVDTSPFAKIIQEEGLLRRMGANTYAALCELDWFMGGNKNAAGTGGNGGPSIVYDLEYPGQLRIRSDAKPFDVCYLVTAMNEHGRRLRRLEDLTEMMAREIFLEVATPLGRSGRSALDNVERLSHFSQFGDRPLAYSSFAVSSLNFTPELLRQQCTLRLALHTLQWLTNNHNELTALSVQVEEQLRDLPTNADGVVELLVRLTEGNPNSKLPELAFPSGTEGEQYQEEVSRMYNDLVFRLENYTGPTYRNIEIELSQQLCGQLDKVMQALFSSCKPSFGQVADLTESWIKQVKTAQEVTQGQTRAAQEEAARLLETVTQCKKQIEKGNSEGRWISSPRRNRHIATSAQEFLQNLATWAGCQLDVYQWKAAQTALESLEQRLRMYRDSASRLREQLTATIELITKRSDSLQAKADEGSKEYQLEFEVLDAGDVDNLAAYLLEHVRPDELSEAILGELVALGTRTNGIAGGQIIECLDTGAHTTLTSSSLLEVLHQIHENSQSGIERQMKKLVEYTAPFWHLILTNCPEAGEWSVISLVGYAGASSATSSSEFKQTLQKVLDRYTTVDIPEPNRVVFLNTKHGIPLFALSVTSGLMRSAYYAYRDGWLQGRFGYKPVHLAQKWMNINDLNPAPKPS